MGGWGNEYIEQHWITSNFKSFIWSKEERKEKYHPETFRRSVTARIGFSVDLDLHEESLRRIRSRWCKNHVESDLYVFVSVQFFPFRMNLLSIQKH